MPDAQPILLGEFARTLDERYRLTIPPELSGPLTADSPQCALAKERAGCLSLWSEELWQSKVNTRVELAKQKLQAGLLENRIGQVQLLGRLLSSRHQPVRVTGRGRLLIPDGFRQFLGVQPGKQVMVVGAAVCVEIWSPAAWLEYLRLQMPKFRRLVEKLS